MSGTPGVAPFTVRLRSPSPKLTPVYSAEADASGNDAFDAGTKFVDIVDPAGTTTKTCLLFVPNGADAGTNKIHVCWSPGDADSEALTGAFRFAADKAGWILFVVPGADPGFVTISADEIVETMRKAGRPTTIDTLRLSAHSRGFRGLAATLNQDLLVLRSGAVTAPRVGPGVVERVVNFDAYYFDFFKAMNASKIPASKIFGYHVTIPIGSGPAPGVWSASRSQTVDLGPVISGVRAILYSRLILDAARIGKRSQTPPSGRTLADITGRLLTNLPALGNFSSRATPADYRAFCKIPANATAITTCLRDEKNTNLDTAVTGPLIEFVNNNNLAGIGAFTANIWAHQLFVCEFAHEVTDAADPKP